MLMLDTLWQDCWKSDAVRFSLLFAGENISEMSLRHVLTNSPSLYGFSVCAMCQESSKRYGLWVLHTFLEQLWFSA